MALTKSRSAITQLTASGTSTTMSVSTSYGHVCLLKHSNGTGTVTAGATADVQVQTTGGSLWYSLTGGTIAFTGTAAASEDRAVAIPDAVASVRVVYVGPTGPTGFTLDAECGTITAL